MPRNKCTQVIAHRLSFSDYERKEIKQYLDTVTDEKTVINIQRIGLTVAAGAAAAGVCYVGWVGWQWVKYVTSFVSEVTETATGTAEAAWKQTGIYRFFFSD